MNIRAQQAYNEETDTMDFTTFSRPELRDYLNATVGEAWLTDESTEALVLAIEDAEAMSTEEFWQTVQETLK